MIVAVAIGLALLIQAFLVKPYRIPSESMEPTLDVGQRVLVSRINYKFSDPDRGDIVVFHPPKGAESNACGAEHAENEPAHGPRRARRRELHQADRGRAGRHAVRARGHSIVNGKVQDGDDDVRPCAPGTCNFPNPIKIPPGHFFMMGDNRGASDDSRFWGPVPEKWIIGQAFATYWPPDASASSSAQKAGSALEAAGPPPPAHGRAPVPVRPRALRAASWPGPTRRAGGAWRAPGRGRGAARLRPARTREVRALTRLDDSKVHDVEQREALYPLVVRTAARVAVTSRCVRGIDERGLHVTNLAALRDTLRRVAVPGVPLPGGRLPRRRHGARAAGRH